MKIRMCDAMISGTRKVGRRLSGNSRSACIDCQSASPRRSAVITTKRMSANPIVFQKRSIFQFRAPDKASNKTARTATMISPHPAGAAKANGNSPRLQKEKRQRPATNRVTCGSTSQRRSTLLAQDLKEGTFQHARRTSAVSVQTVAATNGALTDLNHPASPIPEAIKIHPRRSSATFRLTNLSCNGSKDILG